ncbi:MAG: toll/interleukin-1 receptor domain-containing protein [Pseudomonadota bacterium]
MADQKHTRATQVFLSYSRHNRDLASEFNISLETYGFDVVYDQEDIASGEPWEARLSNLINEADTTICLISQKWIDSDVCGRELAIALQRGRRVLPVMVEQIDPASVRSELASLQFIFLQGEGRSYAKCIAELVDALNTDVEWVREQSRLLNWASDWAAAGKSEALRLRGEALEAAIAWRTKDTPRDVKVLPLVSEFIGFSEECEDNDQRRRLRNRIRVILLGAVALLGTLGSITAFILLDLQRTKDELQESDNSLFASTVGAQTCDDSCSPSADVTRPPRTRMRSIESPSPQVRGRAPAGVASSPPPPPPPASESQTVSEGDQQAADRLVDQLNSGDRDTRIQAGQSVANALRGANNAAILRALVKQLQRPARDALSASGRFNILYMINLSDGWGAAGIEPDLRAAIDDISARQKDGVAVGNQTGDCLAKIEQRLGGDDSVSRRCGGL